MGIRLLTGTAAMAVILASVGGLTGCGLSPAKGPTAGGETTKPAVADKTATGGGEAPCPTGGEVAVKTPAPDGSAPCPTGPDADSPARKDDKPPAFKEGKRLWANSFLWAEAPKLEVEKWLSDKPETKGKYVLLEFWATWCGPCRRSIPLLNTFHRKYKDELVVIGISDETEADVRKLKSPQIEYYSAIDTKARTKKAVGVWGIPHVLIIEPGGAVIWQGFPLLKDYELTEETIEKILAIGRKIKAAEAAKKQK